jgi:GNAT superfamily N-acetyltransferase
MGGGLILEFRSATPNDVDSASDLYLRSRKELVACAPLVHSDDAVREWIRRALIPAERTTLATVDDRVVGLLAVAERSGSSFIDQLYLLPEWVRRGIGTRLLERARGELAPPIRLYTFQCNHPARRFYEQHGFQAIAFGDGSCNEERCPDILYEWRPRSPSVWAS